MHVNHSQINSSKKCGFESHDRTKGFHRKTARQNRSQTDNHHVRQSFIWQLSLCGNYTPIFDPENAPYHCGSFWLYRTNLWSICCTFILLNFWTDPSWYHDNIVICLTVFDLSRNSEIKCTCICEWHHLKIPTLGTYKHWDFEKANWTSVSWLFFGIQKKYIDLARAKSKASINEIII